MPGIVYEDRRQPVAKRRKLSSDSAPAAAPLRPSRIFSPFRTVGLVSPTLVPFTSVPLGKTTFQITTSVGRSLQTYDLKRGLNLVFVTRPQTPGPISATIAWADKVAAAWSTQTERGVWIYKRGKKIGQLEAPLDPDEDIVQLQVFGSWIVACCRTKIEVWSALDGEHYTTLASDAGEGSVLTGGICAMPTFTNKIFAGRTNGTVEIWNVSTGRLIYKILPPTSDAGAVTALEPTPSLSMLAIAYENGMLLIQDVRTDKEIIRLRAGAHDNAPVTCISFRTDGLGAGEDGKEAGIMATASLWSGDVTLWDLNDGGKRVGTLRAAHAAPTEDSPASGGGISGLEFLPGQSVMVTSGLDNALKTWIFDETPFSSIPRPLHARRGHGAPVTTLNFLPSDADGPDAGGKWLLSTSIDRSFWGFSLRRDGQSTELSQGAIQSKAKKMGGTQIGNALNPSANIYQELKAPEVSCLACSLNRDGGMGAMPGVKTLWKTAKQLKGKSTETEQNLTGWESVVTGHKGDKAARTWFWGRKRAGRWVLETGDSTIVSSVAISACGTFALVGSEGGSVDMYNLQSGFHRQRFPARLTPAQARQLQIERAKADQTITSSMSSNILELERSLKKHTGPVVGIHADNLNRTVVTADADGVIKFWDFQAGRIVNELDWHTETGISAIKAHRPSDMLAVACTDLRIRVVDIETQKTVRDLGGCKEEIRDLCFSNDGRWIVAASADKVVRVWDLPTGHLIDAMQLPDLGSALAFSNTGEFLATAQEHGSGIDIWTNRTLFSHVPTRQIGANEITLAVAPTASGEGGHGLLAAAFDEDVNQDAGEDGSLPTLEQLSREVETLSLVPKSRWQTLLNLDLIRERNKPTEAPKAPEKAPFFLPSLEGGKDESLTVATRQQSETTTIAERSRIMQAGLGSSESTFTQMVRKKDRSGLVEHLKTLAPAAADIEIRSLSTAEPHDDLRAFIEALTGRLQEKRDYELVQAWMAVFLRCHGEVVQEDGEVKQALQVWRAEQRLESERLGKLAGFCSGVVNFLRTSR